MTDLNKHFEKYGFIHIPGVLSEDEVRDMRQRLDKWFAHYDSVCNKGRVRLVTGREAYKEEWVFRNTFKEKAVSALKEILGDDYVMFADMSVHRNIFGFNTAAGWHWDSSSEGKQNYFYDPDYRFVKCCIYMQENTTEFGGGVDIVPGAHTFPLKTQNPDLAFKVKYALDELGKRLWPKTADLKPGDFLAFHSCLPHRGTTPRAMTGKLSAEERKRGQVFDMPDDKNKYVIYWDSCRNNDMSISGYHRHIYNQALKELAQGNPDKAFRCSNMAMTFPDDYHPAFAEYLAKNNLSFEGAATAETAQVKEKFAQVFGITPELATSANTFGP